VEDLGAIVTARRCDHQKRHIPNFLSISLSETTRQFGKPWSGFPKEERD